MSPWRRTIKFDPIAAELADRHYSRRTVGSKQFMPPGEMIVLVSRDGGKAVFGWWRPHPDSGLKTWNGLDGWTCTIFRNEGSRFGKSSDLILAAELFIEECGPDGLITYVWDKKIKSSNPGCCFKKAGWKVTGRSVDDRKTLLQKPFELRGVLGGRLLDSHSKAPPPALRPPASLDEAPSCDLGGGSGN